MTSTGQSGQSGQVCSKCATSASQLEPCEGSLTSETGSYSCSSNMDRSDQRTPGKPREYKIYPNVIMVMSHSERLDEFFPNWISKSMNEYKPYDLNMPMVLPVHRPPQAYQGDPPITNTGDILARLIGRGMYSTGYVPDIIYSSPSLRCLQTAYAVKQVSKSKARIRVEPGLFDNFNNYPVGLPEFANAQQRAQFDVDESYEPHTRLEDLVSCKAESNEVFNMRVRHSLVRISKMFEVSSAKKDQLILIVADSNTFDIAAGTFAKKGRPSTDVDLCWDKVKIPHGSLLVLERVEGRHGWTPNLYAIPPVNYRNLSTQFDVGFVLREGERKQQAAAAK
ncbi:Phosphoglycerate mutase family protein [Trichostrongylus colubriformis]|uniref:Phosphoglycerate mutase family protein n=1 Tax=Trichostrongylus colubriformis TaxID=6319 RepID=A0AAN8FEN8_TRICO